MEPVEQRLKRMREERLAREKARIEKLKELNLKKYAKNESQVSSTSKPFVTPSTSSIPEKIGSKKPSSVKNLPSAVKNNDIKTKRPITAPSPKKPEPSRMSSLAKPKTVSNKIDIKLPRPDVIPAKAEPRVNKIAANIANVATISNRNHEKALNMASVAKNTYQNRDKAANVAKISNQNHEKPAYVANVAKISEKATNIAKMSNGNNNKTTIKTEDRRTTSHDADNKLKFMPKKTNFVKSNLNIRKSMIAHKIPQTKPAEARKSMQPKKTTETVTNVNIQHQSVFERLYQPKKSQTKVISDAEKLRNDPEYLRKVIKSAGLILNKRHTMFEPKKVDPPVRRSISAVHFKRICQSELKNCIKKWSSIGENMDKVPLKERNEDASVRDDKIVSAVKSDRKKVKFQTPLFNFNTPRPEEMQVRLQNWLQKRGKSLDSYHHLQCFGIHHLSQREIKPLNLEMTLMPEEFQDFTEEDENKENVPLDSDSDNESYHEIMNEELESPEKKVFTDNKWRQISIVESVDLNETQDTMTPSDTVDDLLLGALNDLTELLREGFDWEQCARWLRAIRQRFPSAPDHAAYWECRAALEERRGDLASSVECWEEAIVKGTERSVVEANLDQLLDKFMQLKISPNKQTNRQPDPKLVDIKNVFKSTLIRFAVQQAKLRQSTEAPKFTITPVRRSGRLSARFSGKKTSQHHHLQYHQPLSSVKQAASLPHPVQFVPNHTLTETP